MSSKPCWLVRKKTGTLTHVKGIARCTVEAELVWSEDNTVHHSISGPTAEKSMEEYAALLNQRGVRPSSKKPVKCRADGVRIKFKQGDVFINPEGDRK